VNTEGVKITERAVGRHNGDGPSSAPDFKATPNFPADAKILNLDHTL